MPDITYILLGYLHLEHLKMPSNFFIHIQFSMASKLLMGSSTVRQKTENNPKTKAEGEGEEKQEKEEINSPNILKWTRTDISSAEIALADVLN